MNHVLCAWCTGFTLKVTHTHTHTLKIVQSYNHTERHNESITWLAVILRCRLHCTDLPKKTYLNLQINPRIPWINRSIRQCTKPRFEAMSTHTYIHLVILLSNYHVVDCIKWPYGIKIALSIYKQSTSIIGDMSARMFLYLC